MQNVLSFKNWRNYNTKTEMSLCENLSKIYGIEIWNFIFSRNGIWLLATFGNRRKGIVTSRLSRGINEYYTSSMMLFDDRRVIWRKGSLSKYWVLGRKIVFVGPTRLNTSELYSFRVSLVFIFGLWSAGLGFLTLDLLSQRKGVSWN